MDNQTIMQYFEWNLPPDGLLWQRAAAQAKSLKDLGFDILWLPPAYKGAAGSHDVGYGVYDLYDLGEFDQKGSTPTKYGSREEYLAAIKEIQKAGLAVLGDIVLNHRMGADETEKVEAEKYDPENRTHRISGEIEIDAWTKYTFPGRGDTYSNFKWNWECFSGIDWNAATNEGGLYRFADKQWSDDVAGEKGNFDYLMGADVDMENPAVVEELEKWGRWYVKTTGIDGFRLDAVKHISWNFYEKWLDAMREEHGQNIFAVGEYWSGDVNELTAYLANTGDKMSLFDVPLHFHFMDASNAGGSYDMKNMLQGSLVAADTMHAVTFVDNHDSQPGQSLQSWVQPWFKPLAYATILLRRDGLPCVFYADYYGLRADGLPAVPGIKRMVAARRRYAYGGQHDYFDHENVVGWTREGDDEHKNSGCAVLMSDGPGGEKTMYVGKQFAGRQMRDAMRREEDPVTIGGDGNALFKAPGGGLCVYLLAEAYDELAVDVE